jgi:serine/threonine protein kinase
MSVCPSEQALRDSLELGEEAHLEVCEDCQKCLESIAGLATFEATIKPSGKPQKSKASEMPDLPDLVEHLKRHPGVGEPSAPLLTLEDLPFLEPTDKEGVAGMLGVYEVLSIIAHGGMGGVLRARDLRLHREVAIKGLSPAIASSEKARSRFLREARAMAALDHLHILPLHHVEGWHGLLYLVMPLVAGSLQDKLKQAEGKPLPFKEMLALGAKIARGLAMPMRMG